jgi:hypothetical protein
MVLSRIIWKRDIEFSGRSRNTEGLLIPISCLKMPVRKKGCQPIFGVVETWEGGTRHVSLGDRECE